jgi:hypothetical protein
MASLPLNNRPTAVVHLDTPIVRGEITIDSITLRSPTAGELRGIKLIDLTQFDVSTLIKVVPRISDPILHEVELVRMGVEDMIAIGDEVANFLPQKGKKPDSPSE